jgi:CO/xanthine dehydrogenase Mo-binding subunit
MQATELRTVGASAERIDGREKLTGAAQYTVDIRLPGLLHAAILRAPLAHARIVSIDVGRATALPGVAAVLTVDEMPRSSVEGGDEAGGEAGGPVYALTDVVRRVGDEVAAVAAVDIDTTRRALALIDVAYEPLPAVFDPEQALLPDAPQVRGVPNLVGGRPLLLERGDVRRGLAEAVAVYRGHYETQVTSGSPLEPRAVVAAWDEDGGLTVWKASRFTFGDRRALAKAFGLELEPERVRVVVPHVGASYGNKDESRIAFIAAALAKQTGRPVRLAYTRGEELADGRLRHPARIDLAIGLRADGTIAAIEDRTVLNTGPYVPGTAVLRRSAHGPTYLYDCANVRFEGYCVFTNGFVAGSYRGLGAPQGHFALESLIDEIAVARGEDPLAFRLRNVVKPEGQPGERYQPTETPVPSQPIAGGIPFSSNGLRACLQEGAARFGWQQRARPHDRLPERGKYRGQGLACCIYQTGQQPSSAQIEVGEDGRVVLLMGTVDVGQGGRTVLAQMAAEPFGLPAGALDCRFADTASTPFSSGTWGSSTTFSSGQAAKEAAEDAVQKLLECASDVLDLPGASLRVEDGRIVGEGVPGDGLSFGEAVRRVGRGTVQGYARVRPGSLTHIINSFAAHFVEVEVDVETGLVRILRIVAAHDCGRVVNPATAAGQVRGGVTQAIGYALFEEMLQHPDGRPITDSFLKFRVPHLRETPPIEPLFCGDPDPFAPYGAKALGEPPLVPTAAAIANAVYDAVGVRIRSLPLTPARVLAALAAAR